MSGRRYFYTDPLAAAWMGKHFGMKLYQEAHVHMLNYKTDEKFISVRQFPLETWETIKITEDGIRLYIRAESLHLLEPNPSTDLTRAGLANAIEAKPPVVNEIIQRNGIAFMWPESEEA